MFIRPRALRYSFKELFLIDLSNTQIDSDDEREAVAAKIALGHKMVAQSKKKMKNKARLPRTAGLRTLSDLTADLTKAGVDPSRVQERAVMIAKMHAAGRKRKRDEGEDAMDVDGDGNDDDDDDDNWASEGEGDAMMDVDDKEQDTRHGKRGKSNSGALIARKHAPRSNRQLAGLRDEAVRVASCFCRRSFSADGRLSLFAMGDSFCLYFAPCTI
jgi:nucleolar GTP-binding protein